jgi:hypothetical protein
MLRINPCTSLSWNPLPASPVSLSAPSAAPPSHMQMPSQAFRPLGGSGPLVVLAPWRFRPRGLSPAKYHSSRAERPLPPEGPGLHKHHRCGCVVCGRVDCRPGLAGYAGHESSGGDSPLRPGRTPSHQRRVARGGGVPKKLHPFHLHNFERTSSALPTVECPIAFLHPSTRQDYLLERAFGNAFVGHGFLAL